MSSALHPLKQAILDALGDLEEVRGPGDPLTWSVSEIVLQVVIRDPSLTPTKAKVAYHLKGLVELGHVSRRGVGRATTYGPLVRRNDVLRNDEDIDEDLPDLDSIDTDTDPVTDDEPFEGDDE